MMYNVHACDLHLLRLQFETKFVFCAFLWVIVFYSSLTTFPTSFVKHLSTTELPLNAFALVSESSEAFSTELSTNDTFSHNAHFSCFDDDVRLVFRIE